VLHKQRFPLL